MLIHVDVAVNNKNCSVLPWKLNNGFFFCAYSRRCSCQQYKSVQYCLGNSTMDSFFMLIHVDVAVNNIKVFSVALETQQWILFYAYSRRCSCQQ